MKKSFHLSLKEIPEIKVIQSEIIKTMDWLLRELLQYKVSAKSLVPVRMSRVRYEFHNMKLINIIVRNRWIRRKTNAIGLQPKHNSYISTRPPSIRGGPTKWTMQTSSTYTILISPT